MPAPIKNFTTTIPADQTIGEILGILSRAGALTITHRYDAAHRITALEFSIMTSHEAGATETHYELPMHADQVQIVLRREYHAGKITARQAAWEHANNVGWRITKDWLTAQLALIQIGLATLDQVMMPYLLLNEGPAYSLWKRQLAIAERSTIPPIETEAPES